MSQEGKIITGIIATTIFLLLLVFFVIVLVAYFNKRKKVLIAEKKSLQARHENELLKVQLEIQEQTFKEIGQELHDNIGQALSFIKLNINTINLDHRVDAAAKLLESKKELTNTIQDLRNLSKSLDTDFISRMGLVRSVTQQMELLKRTGLYEIELAVTGDEIKYPLQQELIIFRIVQETLNNFVKHAAATRLVVGITYEADQLQVIIEDNGVGFDAGKMLVAEPAGIGLHNMASRMRVINGSFNIESAPGKGTKTTITQPLQHL